MTRVAVMALSSLVVCAAPLLAQASDTPSRARDLGIPFDGVVGPHNAITDVPGVLVGQTTLVSGDGQGAIRTGVTAILPSMPLRPYPAATFVLNGDAEFSGAIFAEEFGYLRSPIVLTGTASNGTVYTSIIKWSDRTSSGGTVYMPVVADTWDGYLNNFMAFPLREDHVYAALDGAHSGPVAEGSVGGGTGMFCYDFKCGIGTSSRVLPAEEGGYTIGALVQSNYGDRAELRIAGVPVGREIPELMPDLRESSTDDLEAGVRTGRSILIVIATDAPLTARSLKAVARRAALALGRNGATSSPYSGDVVLALSTMEFEWSGGVPDLLQRETIWPYDMGPIYTAAIEAVEEAVINSLVAGRTMIGLHGTTVHGIPHDRLRGVLSRYNRLVN